MTSEFTVYGEPVPKERPRKAYNAKTQRTVVYTPNKTKKYEASIREAWLASGSEAFAEDTPLYLLAKIYLKIPESASKKKKAELNGTPCMKAKDADNIVKAIADAGNDLIYPDDKAITDQYIFKRWSLEPRVDVVITDDRREWADRMEQLVKEITR